MNKLVSNTAVKSTATQTNEFSSSRRTTNTTECTSLSVEITNEYCGCKSIHLQHNSCNGEDIAQVIVYLAETLAPYVGAENASDILMDLATRDDFNTTSHPEQGVYCV